nr:MAG TPA: hypothetical protein [Caudoviricetes sp.]
MIKFSFGKINTINLHISSIMNKAPSFLRASTLFNSMLSPTLRKVFVSSMFSCTLRNIIVSIQCYPLH